MWNEKDQPPSQAEAASAAMFVDGNTDNGVDALRPGGITNGEVLPQCQKGSTDLPYFTCSMSEIVYNPNTASVAQRCTTTLEPLTKSGAQKAPNMAASFVSRGANSASTHDKERAFFDSIAGQAIIAPIDTEVLKRYRSPRALHRKRDFSIALLGDLRGKVVLDVGCGEGHNSVLFSAFGARVVGLDISSGAIDVAEARATINGLDVAFVCAPVEELQGGQLYDIIWVEALLHHVLHDLPSQLSKLKSMLAPGGRIVMVEPVNLSAAFRSVRLSYGPEVIGTEDERPLERRDLRVIEEAFPGVHSRLFHGLTRVQRLLFANQTYERAPLWKRFLFDGLSRLDRVLLSLPILCNIAGISVLWWNRPCAFTINEAPARGGAGALTIEEQQRLDEEEALTKPAENLPGPW
jgi:2-polyprenyl-3-methyl-5-hydroxy-6-metoxy-1,4-benzoquinol methylase